MERNSEPRGVSPPGIPRWVKVIGVVLAAALILVVVAQVTGLAGEHGPGRHIGGLGAGVFATAVGSPW